MGGNYLAASQPMMYLPLPPPPFPCYLMNTVVCRSQPMPKHSALTRTLPNLKGARRESGPVVPGQISGFRPRGSANYARGAFLGYPGYIYIYIYIYTYIVIFIIYTSLVKPLCVWAQNSRSAIAARWLPGRGHLAPWVP